MRVCIYEPTESAYRTKFFEDFFEKQEGTIIRLCKGNQEKSGNAIVNLFFRVKKVVTRCINIAWADLYVICAMNQDDFYIKVARILHKKIIMDFYISFYDTLVLDRRVVSENSYKAKKLTKKDRTALLLSDITIFLNEAEAQYYCDLLKINRNSVQYVIIPTCVKEKKRAKLHFFHDENQTMNLCWSGTYIPLQGLECILEAYALVRAQNSNIKLYIWGDSEEKWYPYMQLAEKLGIIDKIEVHNEWNVLEKWEKFIIENCDVSLGIFGDSVKAHNVISNKVIDGVAFRTPVITGWSKGLSEYFDGERDIYVVDNTPQSLADKILELYSRRYDDICGNVDRAYTIWKSYFTQEYFNQELIKIIGKIERKQ